MEHGLAMFQRFVPISMAPNLEPKLKANGKPKSSKKSQILPQCSEISTTSSSTSAIYMFLAFDLQEDFPNISGAPHVNNYQTLIWICLYTTLIE